VTDLIFANGRLFDGLSYHHEHAVGVRGHIIHAVGPLDRVREEMSAGGGKVEELDVEGGLVMPAFHDAHIHPMIGGLEMRSALLTDCGSAEACLDSIAGAVAEQEGDGWFRAGGWSLEHFDQWTGPTAEALDRVVPHRPAFLPSNDHHNAWVNTRALEMAGIDRETPDPPDGWIERDRNGNPTGTLREAAALWYIGWSTPPARRSARRCETPRHISTRGGSWAGRTPWSAGTPRSTTPPRRTSTWWTPGS